MEDALEDERLVAKLKKKPNTDDDDVDELFTVDTAGSFDGISKSSRRELARAKIFPAKGPNIGMSASEELKISRAEGQLEASKRPVPPKAADVFDLWSAPAPARKVNESAPRLRTAKQDVVKTPKTMHQKVGLAPAVLPAHEGQSMNPKREAYEELAFMAAAVELEKEHEAEDLHRKLRPMTAALRDAVGDDRLKDMDEEEKMQLYKSLVAEGKIAAKEGGEGIEGAPSKKANKWKQKSQALRNKQKKRRDVDAQEEQEKDQRRMEKSVGDVGSMLKTMKEDSDLHKSRRQYKESMRAKRKELEATAGVVPKKRKIGGGKFVEDASILPDVEASSKGSLRAMPLRTSAIRDRLSSVVRRGLLPPPSEATKETAHWHKKKNNKLKRSRKFISPLLKDNLLLR